MLPPSDGACRGATASASAGPPRLVLLDAPQLQHQGREHALPQTLPAWLLVLLGVRGDWVSREELIGLLWPDEPEAQAQHRFRVHLHRLKQWLGDCGVGSALESQRHRVRLQAGSDVADFRDALGSGRRDQALDLYRRPLLEGWRLREFPVLEEWLELERQQLAVTWRSAAVRHAKELAEQGRHPQALDLLERLRRDDPLAEDVVQQLLRSTAQAGEPGIGLRAYADFVQRLRAELAVEPMQATQELAQALRNAPTAPVAAVPQPVPKAHSIPQLLRGVSPFVGREPLVQWLRSEGSGVNQVMGPPGIGKTRLVEQAVPDAVWLRCREPLADLPLHPMLEVLRAERTRLESRLGVHAAELARLVPDYAPQVQPPTDPQLAKPRLFEALVVAFGLLEAPVVIDDVQWADALTIEWLAFAAPRRTLRIVVIRRDHERNETLERTLRALEIDALLDTRAVAPLNEVEMRQLLAGLANAREGPPQFSAWLMQRCAGNPFYAMEILRHLFDAGQLLIEDGQWASELDLVTRDYSELVVPPRVLAVTQARMSRLSEQARRVLEAAAILDEAARPGSEALSALSGLTADTVAEAWEELDSAGFLQGRGIAHDLVRQSVQQGLSTLREERLHRRAAEHFETLSARQPGIAAIVARHWRLAGERQRALPAAMQAAQALRESGALEAAAEAFAGIAREAEQPALRLRAEAAAAEHLLFSDLVAERQALERIETQLATLAGGAEADALRLRVHTALAENAVYAGDLPRAARHVAALQPFLTSAPNVERLHALEIVIEVAMRLGDFGSALKALEQARQQWPGKVTLDIYEAMLAWSQVRLPDAVRIFERVARDHPEHGRYIMVENDLGVALLAQGDLAAAEQWVRRSLITWDGIPHAQCLSRLNLGAILTSAGRWAEAQEALAQALALAREQHSALFEGEAQHRLGRLHLLCGKPLEARSCLDAATDCLDDEADPLRVAQWHAQAVGPALACGDQPKAELHLQRADACLANRVHALAQARVARAHAWLALARRRAGDAQQAAEQMHALARAHGLDELDAESLLLRARSHALAADTLAGAERAAAVSRAVALVNLAHEIAERRGLTPLAWRSQALLAELGAGPQAVARERRLRQVLFDATPTRAVDAATAARIEPAVLLSP